MSIRPYNSQDLKALQEMHLRQGFEYAFPDLEDPIFVTKLVVQDNSGRPVMAALARLTCEIYLLLDPEVDSPRDRYTRLLDLHRIGEAVLAAQGLEDAHAWIPPTIAQRFGRRLEALGWVRDDEWTPYSRRFAISAGLDQTGAIPLRTNPDEGVEDICHAQPSTVPER